MDVDLDDIKSDTSLQEFEKSASNFKQWVDSRQSVVNSATQSMVNDTSSKTTKIIFYINPDLNTPKICQ